ncbi:hypothetical protein SLS56_008909 [Neofusicoccum ribis]|uniref:Myosin heavy chain n=1 Tax=Neofusicoccum ribis TaxID=45134 RepID=A0ABR3SIS6_9PEZI
MPSQVGDDRLTGGSKDQPPDECGSDDIDNQFAAAATSEFFQAREGGLLGATGEQHDRPTSAAPTSRTDHANTEAEAVGAGGATAPGAEPTTNYGTSHIVVIARPRSSGEGLDKGFKFEKAKEPQLNMNRRSGPKAQPKENAETRPVTKQGSASRSGKLAPDGYVALPNARNLVDSQPQQKTYGNSQEYKAPTHSIEKARSNAEGSRLQMHTGAGYKAADHPGPGYPPNHGPHARSGSSHRVQAVPPSSVFRENESSARNEIAIPTSAQQSLSAGKFPHLVAQPKSNGVAQDGSPLEDMQEIPNASRIIPYSHDDFGGDGRSREQESGQRTQTMKQQVTRKALASQSRQQRNEEHSSGINELSSMHEVSSRNGPAKVTKSASSSKSFKSTGKPSRTSGTPAKRHSPTDSHPNIHSTEVLAIWQKMFIKEQKEETAKERSKREVCEKEVERLRHAEGQQKAELDDACEAKARAINKLQHLKSINKELNEKVQELKMSYATAASQLEDLRKDKSAFGEVWSKMEKKFEDLDADKKNLITSKDEELQKAVKDLEIIRKALHTARKDCEDASRVAETREKQLHQKDVELRESHGREAFLEKSLDDIFKKILGDYDKSDVPSLQGIAESIKKLLERQLPQESIDSLLAATHAVQSLSDRHNDIDLQGALESIAERFQGKTDDVSVTRETLQHAANALEERLRSLIHELQKKLECSTSTEREISDIRQKNAVLEERSTTLQEKVDSLQQKLNTASSGELSARESLAGVQKELSNLKSTFQLVDSARLRELESSRAVADQELQNARSKLGEEEEKLRTLTKTERELRQEFEQLKVSKQIEQERELAREHYARMSRDICEQQRIRHVNELYEEQQKFRKADENLRSLSAEIVSLKDQIRRKDAEIQPVQRVRLEETSSETQELRQSLAVAQDQLKSQELKISALQKEKESQTFSGTAKEQARTHTEQRTRELQASLEKSSAESAEKLEKTQQQLNSLQSHKQEVGSKYQKSQEMNRTMQEQLESANVEREELRQQLQEAQNRLDEFDQDAEKQRRDVEEELRRREEQRAAEVEEGQRHLQELYARLEENEAIHQLKCKECTEPSVNGFFARHLNPSSWCFSTCGKLRNAKETAKEGGPTYQLFG